MNYIICKNIPKSLFFISQTACDLREFVENSRHPKTPARGLGGSDLRLLTPFPGNPRNPGNPRMNSKNAKSV